MKATQNEIANACYFRSIRREDRITLMREFSSEEILSYADCRKHIRTNYSVDVYKIVLYLIQLFSIVSSIVVLLFFGTRNFSTFWLYALYDVLPPAFLLLTIGGIVFRKIEIKEYKYHWITLLVQLVLMGVAFLRMLYVLAKALESF